MRRTLMLALLCCVPVLSGCLAVAGLTGAGLVVGYVYYNKNEAHQDFKTSFDKTWKATLDVLNAQGYAVPKDTQHEVDSGAIVIDDAKTKLVVRVAREPGDVTRVRVRVGTFDTAEHRRQAGLILEKITSALD